MDININVEKSIPPILWLDTSVIISIVKGVHGNDPQKKDEAEKIMKLIAGLTKSSKIVCPQTEQIIEIENGKRLVMEARRIQLQISYGIKANHYIEINDLQTKKLLKAFVNKDSIIDLPIEDFFLKSPSAFKTSQSPVLVEVAIPSNEEQIQKRSTNSKELASTWEQMRLENRADKETYDSRLNYEITYRDGMIDDLLAKMILKKKQGLDRTPEDVEEFMVTISKPLDWLEECLGYRPSDLEGILQLKKFYQSEYFRAIPSEFTHCALISDLVTGNDVIKPSDAFDMNSISSILPYAHYMVLDKRMKIRVVERLKLGKKYNTEIITIGELLPLLEEIDKNPK